VKLTHRPRNHWLKNVNSHTDAAPEKEVFLCGKGFH